MSTPSRPRYLEERAIPEDRRTNLEKLDDAGLITDEAWEKYREQLNRLSPELVDQIIEAFNAPEAWQDPEGPADEDL